MTENSKPVYPQDKNYEQLMQEAKEKFDKQQKALQEVNRRRIKKPNPPSE